MKLRLLRGGKEKTVSVTLAARPAEPKTAADAPLPMLDTGGHMARINGIAFTPDGRQLVSASEDKTIRVWDLASGKTVRTIRGESAPGDAGKVYAMALSPDGKWLAAGGWFALAPARNSDAIRLYEFASGKLVALLKGHADVVYGLAFSPDGSRLISGSDDNTAILWDTGDTRPVARGAEPKLLHRLEGHKDFIYAVGFSPDGSRAVTGSFDHDLRLWRVADGKEIAHMPGHGDKVRSLAVAPDGTIASGDCSGEIRLWDGRTGAFLKMLAQAGDGRRLLQLQPGWQALAVERRQGYGRATQCHVYDVCQRQGDRHLYRPRQCRARHGLQPGRALGGDRRRRQPGDPPLGPAFGQAPARTRWQAVAARRPGAAGLGGGVLGRWAAHRLGEP